MGHYDFKQDLAEAHEVEERVIVHLNKLNPNMAFHGFSGTKGYDAHFTASGKYYKLEIKSDYSAAETGNIVIEYSSRGKASGILTTEANLWAYSIITPRGLDIYLFPTVVLQTLIKEEKYERSLTGGDPGSNTKMYLFKLKNIAHLAKKLEETYAV